MRARLVPEERVRVSKMSPTTAPFITAIVGQERSWASCFESNETHNFGQVSVTIKKRLRIQALPEDFACVVDQKRSHFTADLGVLFGTIFQDKERALASLKGHLLLPEALQASTGRFDSTASRESR